MSDNCKYIMNMGLAFDEDKLVKKLSELAKEGWILKEMTLFKYKLEKGEPQEIIYSMDYKNLEENKDEYFGLFSDSGWKHMCSFGLYHFFAASADTIHIYTDKESYVSKYKNLKDIYMKMLIISFVSFLVVTLLDLFLSNRVINEFADVALTVLGAVSAGIAVPSLMVTIALALRIKKALNIKNK